MKNPKFEVGDSVSFTQYYQVEHYDPVSEILQLKDKDGLSIAFKGVELHRQLHSAQSFEHEEELTRTELVNKLRESGDKVLSVAYNTKPDATTVYNQVYALIVRTKDDGNRTPTSREVNEALKGKERVLVGYVVGEESNLGRTLMVEFSAFSPPTAGSKGMNSPLRLVDHRTIRWIILSGVLYRIKK